MGIVTVNVNGFCLITLLGGSQVCNSHQSSELSRHWISCEMTNFIALLGRFSASNPLVVIFLSISSVVSSQQMAVVPIVNLLPHWSTNFMFGLMFDQLPEDVVDLPDFNSGFCL